MKHLNFHVELKNGNTPGQWFSDFVNACQAAVAMSIVARSPAHIDVVIQSEEAARAWDGQNGVDTYLGHPEAAIHERIVVRAESSCGSFLGNLR